MLLSHERAGQIEAGEMEIIRTKGTLWPAKEFSNDIGSAIECTA